MAGAERKPGDGLRQELTEMLETHSQESKTQLTMYIFVFAHLWLSTGR